MVQVVFNAPVIEITLIKARIQWFLQSINSRNNQKLSTLRRTWAKWKSPTSLAWLIPWSSEPRRCRRCDSMPGIEFREGTKSYRFIVFLCSFESFSSCWFSNQIHVTFLWGLQSKDPIQGDYCSSFDLAWASVFCRFKIFKRQRDWPTWSIQNPQKWENNLNKKVCKID